MGPSYPNTKRHHNSALTMIRVLPKFKRAMYIGTAYFLTINYEIILFFMTKVIRISEAICLDLPYQPEMI